MLSNDSDLDGDTISVSSVTQPAHGAVVINTDGTVTYTPAANYNGADSFTYTISDGQGGTSTATVSLTVESRPDAPTVVITEDENNDGYITASESHGKVDVVVSLPSDAMAGDTLTVTGQDPITLTASQISDGNLSFSYDKPEDGATITVNATITDQAGHVSSIGTDTAIMGDTTITAAPVVTITEDVNNDGYINGSELNGQVNVAVAIPEGAVAGDTIHVTDGSTTTPIVLNATDISAGSVTTGFASPGEGNTITVSASLTDQAGNQSASSSDSAIVDTAVFTNTNNDGDIAITSDLSKDTNSGSKKDLITNDTTPAIEGNTEAGATVTISYLGADGQQHTDTTTADNKGDYRVDITSALPEGSNDLTVSATDIAGNTASITQSLTIDTSTLATISSISESDDSESMTIIGSVEKGATIESLSITDGSNTIVLSADQVTIDESGNYQTTADISSLSDGELKVMVSASDVAGNVASTSEEVVKSPQEAPEANDASFLSENDSIDFTLAAAATDKEDDASSSDNLETSIKITELPQYGQLYDANGNLLSVGSVLTDSSDIRYEADDSALQKFGFNAQTDFEDQGYDNQGMTQITTDSGVVVSGGTFTGNAPDASSELTSAALFFDEADHEVGLGVNDNEIDVANQEYIGVDFPQTILAADVDIGSVWQHYDQDGVDAHINIIALKDGVEVGRFDYADQYDGSGEFTASVKVADGFDELRIYTSAGAHEDDDHEDETHEDDKHDNHEDDKHEDDKHDNHEDDKHDDHDDHDVINSNITLQGIEVKEVDLTDQFHYQAIDSSGLVSENTGTVTLTTMLSEGLSPIIHVSIGEEVVTEAADIHDGLVADGGKNLNNAYISDAYYDGYDADKDTSLSYKNINHSHVTMNAGDDVLTAKNVDNASIQMGGGDDTVYIAGNAEKTSIEMDNSSWGTCYTNGGNDKLVIDGNWGSASISTDGGDDLVYIGALTGNGSIDLGEGQDILYINGSSDKYGVQSNADGSYSVVSGNFTEHDNGNSHWITGGDWTTVKGAEAIVFSDGHYFGDASVAAPYVSTSETYSYGLDVNVDHSGLEDGEQLSSLDLKISGLNADTKLYDQDGNELGHADDQGELSLQGLSETQLDNAKFESASQIDKAEMQVEVTPQTDGDHDEQTENFLYADTGDDLFVGTEDTDHFRVDADGSTTIEGFDESQDVLDLSDVIPDGHAVDQDTLSQYLNVTQTQDGVKVSIDSNGEADGGNVTDVMIQGMNDTDNLQIEIDDTKMDYDS